MLGPVHFDWLWQRWPVFLAGLACIALIVSLSPPPGSHRAPESTAVAGVVERAALGVIWVHTSRERSPCGSADAGACQDPLALSTVDGGQLGEPIASARVRVIEARGAEYLLWSETRTDAAGRARIQAPAGRFWLLVDAPLYARRSEFVGFDGNSTHLTFVLPAAEPFQVKVHDAAGRPVVGATVLVQTDDELPHAVLTSELGLAKFESVGEHVESLRVNARGYDSVLLNPTARELDVSLSAPAALEVLVLAQGGGAASGAELWVAGIDLWPPRQVRADENGVARLEGLSHGSYDLRARLGTFVSATLVGVRLERGQRERITLQLLAGRSVLVRVSAGEGNSETPVSGADVVLVEDGLSPFPMQGRTGTDGRVSLGPLPLASAVLNVRADGFMPESGVPVPRQLEGEIRINLVRGGRLSGQIVDAEGLPIEGARLEVVGNDIRGRPIARQSGSLNVPRGFFERSLGAPLPLVPMGELGVLAGPLPVPGMPAIGPAPSANWASDLDGSFRLDDVPPGRVRVLARHPDFVESLSAAVTLDPGGEARLSVVLSRGAALSGRLLDEVGQPVARARIDALAPHATQHQSLLTESDGSFAFGAVSPEVDLFVTRPEDRYRFVLRKSLELEPGETRELELVLPAERASALIAVMGDDGRPISEAMVALLSLEPDIPLRQTGYTDASGESEVPEGTEIRATLRVQAAGWLSFEAQLPAVPARVEVTLDRGVTVMGRIIELRGGQGIAGAEVVLFQAGERRTTASDAQGEYEFVDAAPGVAKVSAQHPEFSSMTTDVTIAATGRQERPFELAPIELGEAGSVSGTVLDPEGKPVRGARVGLGFVPAFLPVGPPAPGMVVSGADGQFVLRGLGVGKVTVSAFAAGVGRGSLRDVEVRGGESTTGLVIALVGAQGEAGPSALANVAVTLGERTRGAELEVVIVNVAAGSEAERAGLQSGDVLWAVDGELPTNMADVRRRLGGSDGSDVIIDIERDAVPLSVRVRREPVH